MLSDPSLFPHGAEQIPQLVLPKGVKRSQSAGRLGGCCDLGLLCAALTPVLLVNRRSVPLPLSPPRAVFISTHSWVKGRSCFQLNKHFPSRVKSSLVLIGSSSPLPTFCAVGRTKKCCYYLTYYRHGTVIYGLCLVKCHAENIYSPLTALRGGGWEMAAEGKPVVPPLQHSLQPESLPCLPRAAWWVAGSALQWGDSSSGYSCKTLLFFG